MKTLIAMLVAFGLAAPVATSAFANPTDQLSCEDQGMIWDAENETCLAAE